MLLLARFPFPPEPRALLSPAGLYHHPPHSRLADPMCCCCACCFAEAATIRYLTCRQDRSQQEWQASKAFQPVVLHSALTADCLGFLEKVIRLLALLQSDASLPKRIMAKSYVNSRPAPRFDAAVLSGKTSSLCCGWEVKAMETAAIEINTADARAKPRVQYFLDTRRGLNCCSLSICRSSYAC